MAAPTLREMTRHRRLKVGTSIFEFNSPGLPHIMKAAGAEWVFIDMEHSGFGFESVKWLLQSAKAAELPAFVRVPSSRYDRIARALDVGAEGLVLPMVESADEARHIVDCTKYLPQGHRGVALQVAHDDYRPGPVLKKLRDANRRTAIMALIETVPGLESVEEIAAVPGIDCVGIGHFDLSNSLGVAGQFSHPRFRRAVKRVNAAALANHRSIFRMVASAAEAARLYRDGADMIAYSGDIWVMFQAMQAGMDAVRKRCKGIKPAK